MSVLLNQMEAAHRTAFAKGEVGIRDKKPVPTLGEFATRDFLPFVRSTFAAKPKTLAYYENGLKKLLAFDRLANEQMQVLTSDSVSEYIANRKTSKGKRGLPVQVREASTANCRFLRRMFHLAEEWGKVEKSVAPCKGASGEKHRERVLTADEEDLYLKGASADAMGRFRVTPRSCGMWRPF